MIAMLNKKEDNGEDLKINMDDLTVSDKDSDGDKDVSLVSFKNKSNENLNVFSLENELRKGVLNTEVKIQAELERIEEVNITNSDEGKIKDNDQIRTYIEDDRSKYRNNKFSNGNDNQSIVSGLANFSKDKKRKSLHPSEAFSTSEEVLKASKLSISPAHSHHGHRHHKHRHRTSSESDKKRIITDGNF
jgi:hypothetical protein